MAYQKDGPDRSGRIELRSRAQNRPDFVYLPFHYVLWSALEARDDHGAAGGHDVAVGGA
jgi:hypothetical protein